MKVQPNDCRWGKSSLSIQQKKKKLSAKCTGSPGTGLEMLRAVMSSGLTPGNPKCQSPPNSSFQGQLLLVRLSEQAKGAEKDQFWASFSQQILGN